MGSLGQAFSNIVSGAKTAGNNLANVGGLGAVHPAALTPAPAAPPAAPGAPDPNMAAFADPGLKDIYDSSLLQSQQTPGNPAVPLGVNPLSQQDNAFGLNVLNSPQELAQSIGTPASSAQTNPDEPAQTITGDTFKPQKETALQQIGDFFLGHPFERMIHNRNMTAALKGIQTEPERAISRLNQFDPEAGYTAYKDLQASKRADDTQQALIGTRQERMVGPLRASAGSILKLPEDKRADAWAAMAPQLTRTRDALGIPADVFPIPEQYDALQVQSMYDGGILPPAAERLKQGEEKIGQGAQRLTDTEAKNAVTEGQGAARIGMTRERLTNSEHKPTAGNATKGIIVERSMTKDANGNSKNVVQKYDPGTVQFSPDRSRARKNVNGHWVKFGKAGDGKYYPMKEQ